MSPLACLSQVRWLTWEDKVAYLAWQFKKIEITLPPLEHRFEDGWYVRTMRIPAGAVFVGRRHLEGHIIKLLEGRVMLVSEIGQRYYEAPATMQSRPGYQMVLYTMTDVVGETWHPREDDIKDVEVLEKRIFAPAKETLDRGRIVASQIDYHQIISQFGLSEDKVQELLAIGYAKGVSHEGQERVYVGDSTFNGLGCFASEDIGAGQLVGPAVLENGSGTLVCRYTNHCTDPNMYSDRKGKITNFIALRDIAAGEELTVDYRETIQKALS